MRNIVKRMPMRLHLFTGILAILVYTSFLVTSSHAADTVQTVVSGTTDLTVTAGATNDAFFTGTYSPVTFTLNGTIALGTLDDADTSTDLITIDNTSGTADTLTLSSAANNIGVTGAGNAADLIFVKSGANLNIGSSGPSNLGIVTAVSGNFDNAGTLTIGTYAPITLGAGLNLTFTGTGTTTVNSSITSGASGTNTVALNSAGNVTLGNILETGTGLININNNSTTGILTLSPTGTGNVINGIGGVSGSTINFAGSGTTSIAGVLGVTGQTDKFNSGTWTLNGSGGYTASIVINGATVNTGGSGQNIYQVTSLTIQSGTLNVTAQYGTRFGTTFGTASGESNASTVTQTGGVFDANGSGLQLGGNSGAFNETYNLSGGTLSNTSGGITLATSTTPGATSTSLNLSGTGDLITNGTIKGQTGVGAAQNFTFNGGTLTASAVDMTNLTTSGLVTASPGTLLNNGGTFYPGGAGFSGKSTITGNYTQAATGTLQINVGGTTQASVFQIVNDYSLVAVTGTVSLAGTLNVSLINSFTPTAANSFTVLTGTSVSGSFSNVDQGNRVNLAGGGSFTVTISGTNVVLSNYSSASEVVWAGNGTTNPWDIGVTSDFTNGGTPTSYTEGNLVAFTNSGLTNPTVNLNTTVNPAGVTFTNTSGTYTLTGTGAISGAGSLTVNGAGGTVVIGTNNSYTGGTTISAGTLKLSGSGNLGSSTGSLSVSGAGSVLSLNGVSTSVDALNGTAGAIINNANATGATLTIGSNNGTGTYAGTLVDGIGGGSLSLTKTGTGTETLSGANTYTGATTVNAGTLSVTGSESSSAIIATGGTLSVAGSVSGGSITANGGAVTETAAGILSGGTTLSVTNAASTVSLSGVNTNTGNTLVSAGTLNVAAGSESKSAITVSGGALNLTGGAISGGSVTANGGNVTETTGSISGTTTVAVTNASSTVTLNLANTNTGGDSVSAGTLALGNATALGTGTLTLTGGTINTTGTALTFTNAQSWNGSFAYGGASNATFSGTVALAGPSTVTVNGSTLAESGVISGANTLSVGGAGNLTLSAANTFNGGLTLGGTGTLTLGNAAALGTGTFSLTNGATFNTAGGYTVTNAENWNGNFTYLGSNALTMNGAVTLGGASQFTVSGANTVTESGIIGGGFALTKAGAGNLTLSGANAFTGGLSLSGTGTLTLSNASALGTGTFTIGSGTTFNTGAVYTYTNAQIWNGNYTYSGANNLTFTGAVTLGANVQVTENGQTLYENGAIGDGGFGYSITKAGSSNLALGGNNTFSGGVTLGGTGTLDINSNTALGTGTFTIGGATFNNTSGSAVSLSNAQTWNGNFTYSGGGSNVTFGVGGVTLNGSITITATGNLLTENGAITDGASTYSITKAGSSTLALGGNNTFKGGVTLGGTGTLDINSNTALGTGTFTIGAGTTFNNTSGSAATLTNAQIWNGNYTYSGGSNLTFGVGGVTLNGNITITPTGNVLTENGAITDGASTYSITKAGNGTLALGGNNTFKGGVSDGATGTLAINSAGALGTGALTLVAGSTLDNLSGGAVANSNANAISFGTTLTYTGTGGNLLDLGTGTITMPGSSPTITVNNLGTLGFGGGFTGTDGLTKAGNGTLLLYGANNTYSDATAVNAGTLSWGGAYTTSSSVINIANGATFNITNYGGSTGVLNTNALPQIIFAGATSVLSTSNGGSIGTAGSPVALSTTLNSVTGQIVNGANSTIYGTVTSTSNTGFGFTNNGTVTGNVTDTNNSLVVLGPGSVTPNVLSTGTDTVSIGTAATPGAVAATLSGTLSTPGFTTTGGVATLKLYNTGNSIIPLANGSAFNQIAPYQNSVTTLQLPGTGSSVYTNVLGQTDNVGYSVTVDGGGTLYVGQTGFNGTGAQSGGTFNIGGSASLTTLNLGPGGTNPLGGQGGSFLHGTYDVLNNGSLVINTGVSEGNGRTAAPGAGGTNGLVLSVSNGGSLSVNGGLTLSTSNVQAQATTNSLTVNSGGTANIIGTITLGGGANQTSLETNSVTANGNLTATGLALGATAAAGGGLNDTFTVSGGTTTISGNVNIGSGNTATSATTNNLTISGGSLFVSGTIAGGTGGTQTNTLSFTGGQLTTGTVTLTNLGGTLTNAGGTLYPGGAGIGGKTTVTGNYTQTSGAIDLNFGGTTQASGYQQAGTYSFLSISGTANLTGGTVQLVNSGDPITSAETLVTAGTLTLGGGLTYMDGATSITLGTAFNTGDAYGDTATLSKVGQSLVLTGGVATNYWKGPSGTGNSGTWDSSATNWASFNPTSASHSGALFTGVGGTITLSVAQDVGALAFTTTTAAPYTLTGSGLTLDNGASVVHVALNASTASTADAINVPVTLNSNTQFDNTSATAVILNISGVISGTGSLAVGSANETVNLSGVNTYSGGTSVSNGTLELSGANTFSAGTTVTGGILEFNNAAALGTGSLSISGGTIQAATGGLALNANNETWSGNFSVDPVTGSIFAVDTAGDTVNLPNNVTVSFSGGLTNSVFQLNGNIVGSGRTLTLQSQTGNTYFLNGNNSGLSQITLNTALAELGAANSGSGVLAFQGGADSISSAVNNLVVSGTNYTFNTGTAISFVGTNSLDLGTGTVALSQATTLNMGAGASTLSIGGVISGANAFTTTGSGSLVLYGASTYTGLTTIGSGTTIQLGNGGTTGKLLATGTITDNGTFALDRSNTVTQGTDFGALGTGALNGTGGLLVEGGTSSTPAASILAVQNYYSGTTTINPYNTLQLGATGSGGSGAGTIANSASIVDNGSLVVNLNAAANANATLQAISGTGTLTQQGNGTTTLVGGAGVDNSFTGITTISAGTLQLGNGGTYGSIGTSASVNNNGSLVSDLSSSSSINQISGSGSFSQIGTGLVTFAQNNSFSGTTTIGTGSGGLQLGTGVGGSTTGSLNPLSTITDNSTLFVNRSNNAVQGTDFGLIGGTGGFTQAGSGTTIFNLHNTYSGTTLVSGGTLEFTTNTPVGVGSVVNLNGGGLQINAPGQVLAAGTDFNSIVGSGNIDLVAGSLNLGAGDTSTGNIIFDGGTYQYASNSDVSSRFGAAGTGNYNLDLNGNMPVINATLGDLSQPTDIVVSDSKNNPSSSLTLAGGTTNTGATTVNGGTLIVTGNIFGTNAINLNGTGALSLQAALVPSTTANLNGGSLIFGNYSAVVSTLNVTSTGSGTIGFGDVGTNGFTAGAVPNGTVTLGSLSLASNDTFTINFGNGNTGTTINFTTLAYDNTDHINIINYDSSDDHLYFLGATPGTLNSFLMTNVTIDGSSYAMESMTYGGPGVEVVPGAAVPEPSTLLGGACLVGLLGLRQRRKLGEVVHSFLSL